MPWPVCCRVARQRQDRRVSPLEFRDVGSYGPDGRSSVSGASEDTSMAENLNSVLAFLRVHGALTDDDMTLPHGAGLPAVVRRLRTLFARLSAPNPGFAPPAPFRFVQTTAELQALGKQFR